MDWIGDRLSRLIQEGQKALGRQVVVMSDAKEDEVDDGSDAWEEEPDHLVPSVAGPSISRRGSVRSLRRSHKPRDLPLPPSYSPYPISPSSSASSRIRQFESDSVHHSPGRLGCGLASPPRHIARGTSVELDTFAPVVSSFKEDESTWHSPELRESMARARARYLQRLAQ